MTWRSVRSSHAGFTLVELLLAVTLMSLLMAMAYGGFSAAARASSSGQAVLEQTSKLRITHQFVRRQLNQMLPLQFAASEDVEAEPAMFLGDSRRIQFVAPMPGYLGQGGPQVQVMEVVEGDDGLQLLFTHALLQGFAPDRLYDREPVVLLTGLEYAEFEFLGLDENERISPWAAYWETPEILPIAVRLDVGLGEDSRVTWPLLSAGVRLDEDAVRRTADVQDCSETIRDLIRNREKRQE